MNLNNIYQVLPSPLQDVAVSLYGLHLRRIRRGNGFTRYLEFLEEALSWSRADIETYQLEKLKHILAHAYQTVPFYRTKFRQMGLVPSDITSLDDMKHLPVIRKSDVQKCYTCFVSERYAGKAIMLKTSGSTGTPLTVLRTTESIMHQFANNWRQFRWLGVQFGDRLASFNGRLILPSSKKTTRPYRKNFTDSQTLFSVYHLDHEHMRHMVEELHRGAYAYIVGYPSALATIANYMVKDNATLSGLKAVFSGSETLYPHMRKAIETAFKTRVFDEWGANEVTASFIQHTDGYYYQNAEDSIVEAATNSYGGYNLIVTDLSNQAMPLIRYDIGDCMDIPGSGAKFSFERFAVKSFVGREDDIVSTPDGRKHGRLSHIVKGIEGISKTQIVQLSDRQIVFKVVGNNDFNQAQKDKLLQNARERLGDLDFRIETVPDIPTEANGKFKAVLNRVSQNN